MSGSYDRYDRAPSRRRGVWTHWVPLAVTVAVATAGVAVWLLNQRKDDSEEEVEHVDDLDYDNADYGDNPPYGASDRGPEKPPRPGRGDDGVSTGVMSSSGTGGAAGGDTWGAKMSGALKRTPSPQQLLDSAGKSVAAGVAAAGAAVGTALAAIREEDKPSFADHETWGEEADAKKGRRDAGKKRRTVAIVVSADSQGVDSHGDGFVEHASILSHIPKSNDFSRTKLFVLIYAPGLKESGGAETTSNHPPPSISSSYSNIGHDQLDTPLDDGKINMVDSSTSNATYSAVRAQALPLVEKQTMVLPFTTPNGHVHMLRHLEPEVDVIYLQESLAGDNGGIVTHIQTWFRNEIILVVGAERGSGGGLADSESEAEGKSSDDVWWKKEERVGRGRGVVVVDGMRVADDWARRVQGRD